MDVERELARYIRTELVKKYDGEKRVTRFVLRHAAPGAKGAEVEAWDLSDERLNLDHDDLERLANEIAMRAQTDADGVGVAGPQRYVVQSFKRGDTRGSTRFAFTLRANVEDEMDGGGGDEPPTLRGLVTQQMRHNEALTRLNVTLAGTMANQMARRMEAMDSEMTKMREERSATFLALEAAKTDEHNRELEAMHQMKTEERKDEAFSKLMKLAPVVVNRLAGKNLLPSGNIDPLQLILTELATSLSPEQLQAIAANLKAEQQIQFVEILRTIQERKAKSNGQPESDSTKKEN